MLHAPFNRELRVFDARGAVHRLYKTMLKVQGGEVIKIKRLRHDDLQLLPAQLQ